MTTTAEPLRVEDCRVRWARHLLDALRRTGTGEGKLAVVDEAMAGKFRDPDLAHLAPDHPGRHLTSVEAIHALEADPRTADTVTVAKARQLATTGRYVEPPTASPAAGLAAHLPPPPDADPLLAGDAPDAAPGPIVPARPERVLAPAVTDHGPGPKAFDAPGDGHVEGPGRVLDANPPAKADGSKKGK